MQQHDTRGCAAAPDIVLRGANAAAAAGPHFAPGALAREIGAGGDLLRGHLAPVAFELLGDELSQSGDRALAHLRAGDADHAGVVGLDRDPDIDLGAAAGGALRRRFTKAGRQVETEREPAARGGGADDERATRKLRGLAADDGVHCGLPHVLDVSLAAWSTAARTR